MAEVEEVKSLAYVPEIVLKKRKNNEEWAVRRRTQLAARRQKRKDDAKLLIKKPEQFVKEFRNKELDFVQMRNRVRVKGSRQTLPQSKLIFVIRLCSSDGMHPRTKKILNHLKLRTIFSGVFLKENEANLDMLLRVEPYITYGYPNLKSIRELIFKKGCGIIEKQIIPLTDNTIVEQELGKHGIICLEDIVHEITSMGLHFKEVMRFLMPFKLKRPEGGVLQKTKKLFKDGGDTGNRQDLINELISKMN